MTAEIAIARRGDGDRRRDPGSRKSLRFGLAGLLFTSLLLPKLAPKGDLRGFALIGTALILLAGMALVRAKSD